MSCASKQKESFSFLCLAWGLLLLNNLQEYVGGQLELKTVFKLHQGEQLRFRCHVNR